MSLGDYKCEVSAVEVKGHVVILTSELKLTAAAPSIDDVVSFFPHVLSLNSYTRKDSPYCVRVSWV